MSLERKQERLKVRPIELILGSEAFGREEGIAFKQEGSKQLLSGDDIEMGENFKKKEFF